MFDPGPAPFAVLQQMCSAVRAENCAAAARLVAIGELYSVRMTQSGETQDWAVDAADAVTAEISAVLNVTRALAASHLRYAQALREDLPLVGRAFIAGDIDERTFRAVVFRTGLIMDAEVRADLDARLALGLPRWGALTTQQLAARIDKIVASVDLDAVRRRKDRVAGREVFVGDVDNGLTEIHATVTAADGHATADRLTALAHTVCEHDPRSLAERRADAFGAMAAHADRLACRCGLPDCPAAEGPVASAVVIHVIAERATVDGTGITPAAMLGYEGLIPAEMIAELAKAARLRPLIHPTDAPPEAGYVPSRGLADYVRCRDMTCRFPGCTTPATKADVDHTVPHGAGGPTQAANLKCLCRFHHLIKTFWGWKDDQLPDGTVIWTAPTGARYLTHPGSAYLFPGLCAPTEVVTVHDLTTAPVGDRTAMMPRRRLTRAKQRAADIANERAHNHTLRTTPKVVAIQDDYVEYDDTFPNPPPF